MMKHSSIHKRVLREEKGVQIQTSKWLENDVKFIFVSSDSVQNTKSSSTKITLYPLSNKRPYLHNKGDNQCTDYKTTIPNT